MLLISQIENDQYAKAGSVNPVKLVDEIYTELAERLEARGIQYRKSLTAHILINNVNRDLLFQLFYNLINNAIRYNKEGGRIEIYDQVIHGEYYIVNIKDTGIGIKKNEIETIFDRFKKSKNTATEGYGLGLSIVKSIASYHGITIKVDSDLGNGSNFKVYFPMAMIMDQEMLQN